MRTWVALFVLSSSLLLAGRAAASVGACSGLADGTPCSDTCIASGHCGGGACVSDVIAPDGTPCSSGNQCSMADTCQAGVCAPGATQRVCPSAPDSCHVSACVPALGCTMTLICLDGGIPDAGLVTFPDMADVPDLATAPVGADMVAAPVGADLATAPVGADLATAPVGADMAAAPVGADMATAPVGADLAAAPTSADDMAVAPDGGAQELPVGPVAMGDMAMTPAGAPRTLHVHGSSVGGCDVGGGGADCSAAAALLLAAAVLLLLRRA
jgi:hypothetical protein